MLAHAEATTRSVDDVLDGLGFAMVTTNGPSGLRARPLTLLEQEDGVLRFLVSKESEWVRELTQPMASVQVTFTDGDHRFVSLQGHATVDDDRELVERLWNPAAKVFFEGPEDPAAAVLECHVFEGEWWGAPSTSIGMVVAFAKKALTGEDPGASGRVDPEA